MTTLPNGPDVPDEVPTADYLEQHTPTEPDLDAGDEEVSAAPLDTERVDAHELDADVEADEADLIEQSTSVPGDDEQLDQE
ncbi:MAG TPA: hypothetical protein VFL94_12285 [Actinomycetales bacterium]|nr:hypothetical protein [Actinomycetales bacterium]